MTDENREKQVKVGIANKDGQLGFVFTKGGLRAGAGRRGIGTTKKVSLTLTDDMWSWLDSQCEQRDISRSEMIRGLVESAYPDNAHQAARQRGSSS